MLAKWRLYVTLTICSGFVLLMPCFACCWRSMHLLDVCRTHSHRVRNISLLVISWCDQKLCRNQNQTFTCNSKWFSAYFSCDVNGFSCMAKSVCRVQMPISKPTSKQWERGNVRCAQNQALKLFPIKWFDRNVNGFKLVAVHQNTDHYCWRCCPIRSHFLRTQ